MKKLAIIVCCFAILCSCGNGEKKAESKKADKPAQTEAKSSPLIDVITDEIGSVDSVYYDSEGRITRISQTGTDVYGEKKSPIVDELVYNGIGKLQRTIRRVYSGGDYPLTSEHIFSYTKEGRLYTVTYREAGQKKHEETKEVFSYDRQGRLMKIVCGQRTNAFVYDKENSRIVTQAITDFDDNKDKIQDILWRYEYDENGNCTKADARIMKNVGLLNEDTVHNVYTFVYDTKQRCVEENCNEVHVKYNYNSKGAQVNYVVTIDNQPMTSTIKGESNTARKLLYRQHSTDDFRQPFSLNLDVVVLPLWWFNENLTEEKK